MRLARTGISHEGLGFGIGYYSPPIASSSTMTHMLLLYLLIEDVFVSGNWIMDGKCRVLLEMFDQELRQSRNKIWMKK